MINPMLSVKMNTPKIKNGNCLLRYMTLICFLFNAFVGDLESNCLSACQCFNNILANNLGLYQSI